MKVFISWSGSPSLQIAEAWRDWLPSVIQVIEPYVSSEDIDKGARWSVDIAQELESSSYGILCVTAGNVNAPWLNFEAGALSKSFDRSRVSPFLFDLDRSSVTGPLVQFQSTVYEHDDILRLLKGINAVCQIPLSDSRLKSSFAIWWPKLQHSMDQLKVQTASGAASQSAQRDVNDMVAEILDLIRSQQRELSNFMSETSDRANAPRITEKQFDQVAFSVGYLHTYIDRLDTAERPSIEMVSGIRTSLKTLEDVLVPLFRADWYKLILDSAERQIIGRQTEEST